MIHSIQSPAGPIKVLNFEGDKSISGQLSRGVYEPHVQKAMALVSKSFVGSKRALDIGANIGIHSILLDKLGFCVDCIEGSEENNAFLIQNANMNDSMLITHREFVGDGKYVNFSFNPNNHACSFSCTSSYKQSNEVRTTVKTRKLSEFLENDYDLIKIDIEGAELDTINAAPEFFSRARYVFIELNKFTCENFYNYSIDLLIDKMFSIKEKCEIITADSLVPVQQDQLKALFKSAVLLETIFY